MKQFAKCQCVNIRSDYLGASCHTSSPLNHDLIHSMSWLPYLTLQLVFFLTRYLYSTYMSASAIVVDAAVAETG